MNKIKHYLLLFPMLALFGGCTTLKLEVAQPAVSTDTYPNAKVVNTSLKLVDKRATKKLDTTIGNGIVEVFLQDNNKPLEVFSYIQKATYKELAARGLSITNSQGGNTAYINVATIKTHRANGFSPFVGMTLLEAVVETPNGMSRIAAFNKRGKVPVWSINEVVEPAINQPLSLLVKEFVAKLNQTVYGGSFTDSKVDELSREIDTNIHDPLVYLTVYELGFSNNPRAIEKLSELANHSDEYIRIAAISGLGTLKAESKTNILVNILNTASTWQDRAMAIKSLGDIGTTESLEVLKNERKRILALKSKESEWSNEIISLYL